MGKSVDPEIAALTSVCGVLGRLDSDDARRRVLDFAKAKFNLQSQGSALRDGGGDASDAKVDDAEGFFSRFETAKPAENVALLVARHYSLYGTQSFTAAEIKDQADAAGLIVPARIDMTLNGAGVKGKRFYQRLTGGKYRVTVHGEAFLKAKYSVKKGTAQQRPDENNVD